MPFEFLTGSIRGFDHQYGNNQDWFIHGEKDGVLYGFVADGCGSADHSEVGAKLGLAHLERTLLRSLSQSLSLSELPQVLYEELIQFIYRMAYQQAFGHMENGPDFSGLTSSRIISDDEVSKMAKFMARQVRNYWLFTVIGFIVTEELTLVFRVGDGAIRVNETCFFYRAKDNAPLYPAYQVIPWDAPKSALSNSGFEVLEVDTSSLDLLMIGTDSWETHRRLFRELDQYLSYSRALYRQMLGWAEDGIVDYELDAQPFNDDTTIVALVRRPEPEVNDG